MAAPPQLTKQALATVRRLDRLLLDVKDYATAPRNATFHRLGPEIIDDMLQPMARAAELLRAPHSDDLPRTAERVIRELAEVAESLPDRFWTPRHTISLRWAVKSALRDLQAGLERTQRDKAHRGRGVAQKPTAKAPLPPTAAPSPEPPAVKGRHSPKVRATFHIPVDLLDQARDAVVHLSGPPLRLTLAALAERALRAELERLKQAHTAGLDFPRYGERLKGGRPVGS